MNVPATTSLLNNRWCGWLTLAAAALLVSPTISLGLLASTWRRAAVLAILSAGVGIVFYLAFTEGSGFVGASAQLGHVSDLFDSVVVWTTLIGTAAPFVAGVLFRYGWGRGDVRSAMICATGSFAVLSFGSSVMSDRMTDLESAASYEAGRSAALASLNAAVSKETEGRRGAPESWMAYFLSARVASELAGVEGPVSLEEYRRLMEARRQ